ncbi:Hypothetical predicted protein [Olea europaea subsp. europaea]|uniref:Uncharacterized protein n=1 Tax=Olea europaea subsp. europaea TaxID=158383 RepID=A0A8S0UF74_OLEEU|nr:Hypothetical predicted protein [Olea europaea subsp. europaea]
MIFWTSQKSSASPSKALASTAPAPSSSAEAASSKPVDEGTTLKETSSIPEFSSQPMDEPPSSQGVNPPNIEAEGNSVFDALPLLVLLVSDLLLLSFADTPMSLLVVATSSRSDKGKSSRMEESLVADLAEDMPSSTIVNEDADKIVRSIQDLFAS